MFLNRTNAVRCTKNYSYLSILGEHEVASSFERHDGVLSNEGLAQALHFSGENVEFESLFFRGTTIGLHDPVICGKGTAPDFRYNFHPWPGNCTNLN